MAHSHFISIGAALLAACVVTGCCAGRHAMRPTNGAVEDPDAGVLMSDRWYIESKPTDGTLPYSCSFVEFDERGDYLDFRQQRRSWQKIRDLAIKEKQKLVVVIYCHGWKNNSQSGNVVDFNRFLARLAASPEIRSHGLRVHGLYLAWRGNLVEPYVDTGTEAFRQTEKDFGGPIVDKGYSRFFEFLTPSWIVEQASYWSRKGAAESKVSGVPIARTIFTAANAAKHFSLPGWTNRVFVIGHSFGALMLEKSLGQACVGALTDQWKWKEFEGTNALPATTSTLPFDSILFVNSAAPSIHAKEMADLLWAHQQAQRIGQVDDADTPIIISVTSTADWATRVAHRWANVFAPLYPSLQRDYVEGVLDSTNVPPGVSVPQSYFYEHTPGHNPLLVNRWITSLDNTNYPAQTPANDPHDVFAANLDLHAADPTVFFTTAKPKNATRPLAWKITTEPNPPNWSQYDGYKPVQRGNYWIIRCTKPIIRNHDAIWTPTAMEMYAALYRLVETTRHKQETAAKESP
jgi:hypothetical protein